MKPGPTDLHRLCEAEIASHPKCDAGGGEITDQEVSVESRLTRSREVQEDLRQLSGRLLADQEEEWRKIRWELMDVALKTLAALAAHLAGMQTGFTTGRRVMQGEILKAQRLLEKSAASINRCARELRPAVLDDFGLVPALHSLLGSFMKDYRIRGALRADDGVQQLDNAGRTALFRIAQEALTGVAVRAGATRVRLTLHDSATATCMEIADNGTGQAPGMDSAAGRRNHLSLLSMRERAGMAGGTFSWVSSPGFGTTIRAILPRLSPPTHHQP